MHCSLCLSSSPRTLVPILFKYHMTLFKCHLIFEALQILLGTDCLFLLCLPLAFCLCVWDSLGDLYCNHCHLPLDCECSVHVWSLYQKSDRWHIMLSLTNILTEGMNEWNILVWPHMCHAMWKFIYPGALLVSKSRCHYLRGTVLVNAGNTQSSRCLVSWG